MSLTLLLYWFPIFVGVAFGAQVAGRRHAAVLGGLCAVLWTAVVSSHAGGWVWRDLGLAAMLFCGAAAILLVGFWGPARPLGADGHPVRNGRGVRPTGAGARALQDGDTAPAGSVDSAGEGGSPNHAASPWGFALQSMISVHQQFDAWLEVHRYEDDPWADFDELIRSILFQWVGGIHVRCYRVVSEGDELVSLRKVETGGPWEALSARRGVEGYVATTGRSFVAGDATHGHLLEQLTAQSEGAWPGGAGGGAEGGERVAPAWCFAVVRGAQKIGVVAVERFEAGPAAGDSGGPAGRCPCPWSSGQLRIVELVVGQFWTTLKEVCRGRAAVTTDPGSGGLTRKAFFQIGRELLSAAYRQGEPVVVAVIAIEGLRALDDAGEWAATDDVRASISSVLKQRLRSEDRLGRFDDSRFVLLLRRVDSELATLICRELMDRMSSMLRAQPFQDYKVELRCGLAGSGVTGEGPSAAKPSLERLVEQALTLCQHARQASMQMASDLQPGSAMASAVGSHA